MSWDSPNAAVDSAWALLAAASAQPGHRCRLIVLANQSAEGPSARHLVLRDCRSGRRQLDCYTDLRSAKVDQLTVQPQAELLAYDPEQQIQIRARGVVRVVRSGSSREAAWRGLSPRQKAEYLRASAPATASAVTSETLTARQLQQAKRYFGLLRLQVETLDLLSLNVQTHLRVLAKWSGGSWRSAWVAP